MATTTRTSYVPTEMLKARDILVEGWTKGTSWTVDPETNQRNYCLTGAMNRAHCKIGDFFALARIIDPDFTTAEKNENRFDASDVLVSFNDKNETHLEDVLRVLNQGIKARQHQLTVEGRRAARKANATKARTTRARKARKSS